MQEFHLFLESESSFIQNNKNSNVYEKIDVNRSRLFQKRKRAKDFDFYKLLPNMRVASF